MAIEADVQAPWAKSCVQDPAANEYQTVDKHCETA
jgi:hypothetical protein